MPTETEPAPPENPAGFNPLWLVLGLALLVLLPFGPLLLLAAGLAGMFLADQLAQIPGLLAVLLLFLLAGPEPIGPRLWLAFRWGAGTALVAMLPLGAAMLLADGWLDAQGGALLQAALWIDAAWLLPAALLAWGRPAGEVWPKVLLLGCVATSRLMMVPLFLSALVTSAGQEGMQIVVLPLFVAGICLGMLMLLALCGLAARALQAAGGGRVAPRRLLAALALLALAAQLARLASGLQAGG
ncbi:hypothetical protein [Roseomonas sp. USHLN139]|uniref:hypothetical protein n=1 Tax=Roseomonas sp. USHLN139 TaxID=3081298 RepID=UPI003B011F35